MTTTHETPVVQAYRYSLSSSSLVLLPWYVGIASTPVDVASTPFVLLGHRWSFIRQDELCATWRGTQGAATEDVSFQDNFFVCFDLARTADRHSWIPQHSPRTASDRCVHKASSAPLHFLFLSRVT